MSQPDYVLPRALPLSPRAHRLLFLAALGVLALWLPGLLRAAVAADTAYRGTVHTRGDDHGYHIQAVNLVRGLGWNDVPLLPLADYHLDLTSPYGVQLQATYTPDAAAPPFQPFYRAPGFALLLAGAYELFGPLPLVARLLLAVLAWLTALLLLLLGRLLDRGLGVVAGLLAALVFLRHPMLDFQRILTEIPTTFWLTLFAVLYVWHLQRPSPRRLLLVGLALTAAIFTRSNFVLAVPLLAAAEYARRRTLWPVIVLALVIGLPMLAWSAFATRSSGRFIAFTTQNEIAFPQYNNIDVLEGVGPEQAFQGMWNPGWLLTPDGEWYTDYHYAPQPGENGWAKGLQFWVDYWPQLPRLFFVKLRAGLWTEYPSRLESGQYLGAISVLLLALGLRPPPPKQAARPVPSGPVLLLLQIFLALLVATGRLPFWSVLLVVWPVMAIVSLAWPFGRDVRLRFPNPAWFLAFIGAHALVTMIFGGEPRFHEPLDGLLFLFGLLLWLVVGDYAMARLASRRVLAPAQAEA